MVIPQRSGHRDCHIQSLVLKLRKQDIISVYSPITLGTHPVLKGLYSSGRKSLECQEHSVSKKDSWLSFPSTADNPWPLLGLGGSLHNSNRTLAQASRDLSVWQDTYLSLHLRRAEGHLGQSTAERRGKDQEAWRESALLPACKSPGGLILDVRSIAITFPPHPSTSQICFLHF